MRLLFLSFVLLLMGCAFEGKFLEPKVVVVETPVEDEEVIVRRHPPRVIFK